jgi:hypothetical protein
MVGWLAAWLVSWLVVWFLRWFYCWLLGGVAVCAAAAAAAAATAAAANAAFVYKALQEGKVSVAAVSFARTVRKADNMGHMVRCGDQNEAMNASLCDIVLDAECLRNPGIWSDMSRRCSGHNGAVKCHLTTDPVWVAFHGSVCAQVARGLIGKALAGGGHLVVGFRCMSGRHRSVACAEMLAAAMVTFGIEATAEHFCLGPQQDVNYRHDCGCGRGDCSMLKHLGPAAKAERQEIWKVAGRTADALFANGFTSTLG